MNAVDKKRIEYLDLAKAISIICMVWSHVGTKNSTTDLVIHVFHMPIFFIISGWCYKSNVEFKGFITKKLATLIRPYLIYGTLIYLTWTMIFSLLNMNERIESFHTFVKSILYLNADISPYACVQWFFTALFFSNIIFYFVEKSFKDKKSIFIVICGMFVITGWVLSIMVGIILPYRMPLSLDVAFMGVCFMGAGCVIKQLDLRYIYIPVFIVVSVITVWLNRASAFNMRIMDYGNPILYIIASVSLSSVIVLLSKLICSKSELRIIRGFLYIGKNSIWFLIFNQLYIRGIRLAAELANITIPNIIIILMVVIMMIPTIIVGNRYFGWTIGRKEAKKKISEDM